MLEGQAPHIPLNSAKDRGGLAGSQVLPGVVRSSPRLSTAESGCPALSQQRPKQLARGANYAQSFAVSSISSPDPHAKLSDPPKNSSPSTTQQVL